MEESKQNRDSKSVKRDGIHPQRCSLKNRQSKWKEKLREECLTRVKERRSRLLWESRLSGTSDTDSKKLMVNAIEDIVLEELNKITQDQNASLSSNNDILWSYEPLQGNKELDSQEYEALLLEMERLLYEESEAAMKKKDEALLADYEKACELEEEALIAAAFEHMQIQDKNRDAVLCPLCKKGYLDQQQQLIYCTCCKAQLDAQDDQVDLAFLQRRLSEVLEEHYNKGCKSQPGFCVECKFGVSFLYMKCNLCEACELVF